LDKETTRLLKTHQAHYHFNSIAMRFIKHGGTVLVGSSASSPTYAKVSHHYSHLCIATNDGVRVRGVDNLWVIGDAGDIVYWTGGHIRLPGSALTACLVGSDKVAKQLSKRPIGLLRNPYSIINCERKTVICNETIVRKLQKINTRYILDYTYKQKTDETLHGWLKELKSINSKNNEPTLLTISVAVVEQLLNIHYQ
jgi:hypothetical protein